MKPLYQRALNGTLASQPASTYINFSMINNLCVTVNYSWLTFQGHQLNYGSIPPGGTVPWALGASNYFIITVQATGAFVTVFEVTSSSTSFTIDSSVLTTPNDVGSFPIPNVQVVIPTDSPRILVGCGTTAGGNVVTREQYWERMYDSYSLAAGEERVFSTTTTSGKQATSSTTTDISASLGLSASAGWGPVSASISSSLSANTSNFQQVTVTEEATAYVSDKLQNTTDEAVMYLKWQLTDVVTVFNSAGLALSSVILAENPVLTAGPYVLSNLPPAPSFPEVEGGLLPAQPEPILSISASTPQAGQGVHPAKQLQGATR